MANPEEIILGDEGSLTPEFLEHLYEAGELPRPGSKISYPIEEAAEILGVEWPQTPEN